MGASRHGMQGVPMGRFVNPSNEGFATILRSEYVDKTGLVRLFDQTLDSMDKLVLVSRPRRFGKSYAAQSIVAFYSCGCDSRGLFEGLEVSRHPGWDANLNRLNVISLDMTGLLQAVGVDEVVPGITRALVPELRAMVPDAGSSAAGEGDLLKSAIMDVVMVTGKKFVIVIDEWDAPYRLAQGNKVAQDAYAEWLRALFKDNTFTPAAVAGAYLTGILPIKKYNHQSAVSDFRERTMVKPGPYAPYVGFVQAEVDALCASYGLDIADVRKWYDGYELHDHGDVYSVYAPFSLMEACKLGRTGSYWPSTETYELLRDYIDMDFDGLQTQLVQTIGGRSIPLDPDGFQNDMTSIEARDDVLTLLVHLGYLSYDADTGMARVPNDEVRFELARTVSRSRHPKLLALVRESDQLLADMIALDEDAVARGIQRVHDRDAAPLFYNNEQALRSVVKTALLAAVDEYARIEEMPGGKGYADVAYLPKRGSQLPALVVELKWNRPVESAIEQILEQGYFAPLRGLDVPSVLVGVTYDAKTREHTCQIEVLGED